MNTNGNTPESHKHMSTAQTVEYCRALLDAEHLKANAMGTISLSAGPDYFYNELLEGFQASIKLDRDAGLSADIRDLSNARSMTSIAVLLRLVLGELIEILIEALHKGVERSGWTPENVRRIEHLHRLCEMLPIQREAMLAGDMLQEFRKITDKDKS